ncbi:hypothetical protein T492DRAFT_871501 [Pavlovales sp. CCMP2436]|nr:hypothetical protein T492DRAFT_871501 [Pavlovales sp. CCMP2436]
MTDQQQRRGSGRWERKERITPADAAEAEEVDLQIVESMAEAAAFAKAKAEAAAAAAATMKGGKANKVIGDAARSSADVDARIAKAVSASTELLGAGRRAWGPWSRWAPVVTVAMSIPALMMAKQQHESSRGVAAGAAETARCCPVLLATFSEDACI